MRKFIAPRSVSQAPIPPHKSGARHGLSFDDLASIDFVGLLGHTSAGAEPAGAAEDRQPGGVLAETQNTSLDDLVFWSFEQPFYSINEAAAWLSVSLATMKRLLNRGYLPFVRIGARRKIPLSALRAYVICTGAAQPMPPALFLTSSMGSDP